MGTAENFWLGISVSIYILTAVRFGIYLASRMAIGKSDNPPKEIAFLWMFLLWPITTIIGIWFLKGKKDE